jgi:hypothetical protein
MRLSSGGPKRACVLQLARGFEVFDHYTGVGEVLAIHALDDVFGTLGRRIRVKRGSLFTLDDAKNNNLIFVGSPSENLSLLDIPGAQEFVFQRWRPVRVRAICRRDDSGRNDDVRDGRRGGVCLPPGVGGESTA